MVVVVMVVVTRVEEENKVLRCCSRIACDGDVARAVMPDRLPQKGRHGDH